LHTFFASKDYTFINSNYGSRNNNFMGVGIAFPTKKFAAKMVDLSVVSDSKSGGWQGARTEAPPSNDVGSSTATATPSVVEQISSWFANLFSGAPDCAPAKRSNGGAGASEVDESAESWNLVRSRFNVVVCVRLRPLGGGDGAAASNAAEAAAKSEDDSRDVVVATYHTPCVFWNPAAMTVCCALVAQRVQMLTEGRFPYILAGDFNVKPTSPAYSLFTTGSFAPEVDDAEDAKVHGKRAFPAKPCYADDKWTYALPRGTMRSAYAEAMGREPLFTNYAKTAGMDTTFASTIDYIFFADGAKHKGQTARLKATSADSLDETCAAIKAKCVSLPNEDEPSDHLLIAADFALEVDKAPPAKP